MKKYQPIIGVALVLGLGIAIGVILAGGDADSPLSSASATLDGVHESEAQRRGHGVRLHPQRKVGRLYAAAAAG